MDDETRMLGLIEILLDYNARQDERSDAAMDLGKYMDVRVLAALVTAAARPHEEDDIVDDCSESIGEICVGLNIYDEKMLESLPPFSRQIIYKYVKNNAPHLIS